MASLHENRSIPIEDLIGKTIVLIDKWANGDLVVVAVSKKISKDHIFRLWTGVRIKNIEGDLQKLLSNPILEIKGSDGLIPNRLYTFITKKCTVNIEYESPALLKCNVLGIAAYTALYWGSNGLGLGFDMRNPMERITKKYRGDYFRHCRC